MADENATKILSLDGGIILYIKTIIDMNIIHNVYAHARRIIMYKQC